MSQTAIRDGRASAGGEDRATVGERALLLLREHPGRHAGGAATRRATSAAEFVAWRPGAVRKTSSEATRLRRAATAMPRTAFAAAATWTAETAPCRSISSPSERRTFCVSSGSRPLALRARDQQARRVRTDVDDSDTHLLRIVGPPIGGRVDVQVTVRLRTGDGPVSGRGRARGAAARGASASAGPSAGRSSFFACDAAPLPTSRRARTSVALSRQSASKRGGELGLQRGVLDRRHDLDAVVEVARHQVCAAHEASRCGRPPRRRRGGCARGSGRGRCARGCSRSARGTPGRSEQTPRTRSSMLRTRLGGGVQLLDQLRVREAVHLDPDPRLLARLGRRRGHARISSISRSRSVNGATSSLRKRPGRPNPVRWLKRSATSSAMSSSAVKRPKSS